MRVLVCTEVGVIVVMAAMVLVTYVGLAISVSGDDRLVGAVVLVVGAWLLCAAPVVHDRLHRENGEESHLVWGRGDRRKPPWWPVG